MGLVDHARKELDNFESDRWMKDGIIKVVEVFADMGHSGESASWAIPVINKLLKYENLSPLTDDTNEWMLIQQSTADESGVWQSTRNSEAFSNDRGSTYYLLSEGGNDKNRGPVHISIHKEVTNG